MYLKLLILIVITGNCFALENSNSSSSSQSPRSPRSPREELEIIGNVERNQIFDKKNRVIREHYAATCGKNVLLSVDANYHKKNEPSYLGFWRRGEKTAQTMTPECAESYFNKLKLAYLQNQAPKS